MANHQKLCVVWRSSISSYLAAGFSVPGAVAVPLQSGNWPSCNISPWRFSYLPEEPLHTVTLLPPDTAESNRLAGSTCAWCPPQTVG